MIYAHVSVNSAVRILLHQLTVLATSVLQLLYYACGTRCQSIYGSATVSDSLNGC